MAAGADVYQGRARFVGAHEIEVNGRRLRFKKAVIATGGRASIPGHIKGLDSVPYLTNNNLFNLETLPERLTVLGAGAVGLEMAQAFVEGSLDGFAVNGVPVSFEYAQMAGSGKVPVASRRGEPEEELE